MNFHWIDWAVVFAVMFFFVALAYTTKKYTQSTADFLAANRCAGRYLLTMAEGVCGLGAISIVALWQLTYKSGFISNCWGNLGVPVSLIMVLTGWVIYRYRETRVLTMAQFFEIRYSRNFRIFAAIICWLSGIINFGVFPAVGANFFISYCGLPEHYRLAGLVLPTYQTVIIILVGVALYSTFIGGQIALLVTDFFQSLFLNVVLAALLIFLLIKFPLNDVFDGIMIAEKGKSMVNPFDAWQSDFNPWYFIIGIIAVVFNRLSWQGSQGFNCSAKSPHEAKMAGVLSNFRSWIITYALVLLVPLVGYMIMHHPKYAAYAAQVSEMLAHISNKEVCDQMLVPLTMTLYMPVGLMGAFAAVMIAGTTATHNVSLHSWGSIFVQDIILPLRKKPFTNSQHIFALRLSIFFVGVFVCLFSSFFRQTQHIFYFFALTGAIWLGGIGAVIIGGLYTKWGSTAGAYAALISGSVLATTGMVCDNMWMSRFGKNFFLNGQEIYFFAMLVAAGLYTVFSLFGRRTHFNLDKMLHRGEYGIAGESIPVREKVSIIKTAFGVTEEFTKGDKIIYAIAISQSLVMFLLFVAMTAMAYFIGLTDKQWSLFHYYSFWIMMSASFVVIAWLSIGGIRDTISLFRDLRAAKRDTTDDGRVTK
ncbi:MAG TPA: sodium:solute symporter [Phycisphaerales bacterium]|nr:MAG: hypothetical protein A2Y13_05610 [Planctomycetes bacterium GWC2_45_44]HBG77928.1 sodium:solute symporter [Phycisphaerales bacterium]